MAKSLLQRRRYALLAPLVYVSLLALALLHGTLRPYLLDCNDAPGVFAGSPVLGILILPGYVLIRTPIVLLGGHQAWLAFQSRPHGSLGAVLALNGLLCCGLGRHLDLRQKARALYALACLLGVLSLIVSWIAPIGYQAAVCTCGSFAVIYPIAAVFAIGSWPAHADGLRKTLLSVSLVLLLGVWLFSSLVALALLALGPHFR